MSRATLLLFLILLPFSGFAIAPVTGITTLCISGSTSLSDADPAGTWSSSNTMIATVSASGLVSGVAAGTADIAYTTGAGVALKTVTVIAPPVLTSSLTPAAMCDSSVFNYTPISPAPGATFAWSRATVAGIFEAGSAGVNNPNEQLLNTTYAPVTVTYVYTITAGTCLNTQTVTLVVYPPIRLSSGFSDVVCSGNLFTYVPTSLTAGTTFAWTRKSVTGISPGTTSGTGNISETLTDTITTPVTVAYKFTLSAYGCTSLVLPVVSVLVRPQPCGTVGVPINNIAESNIYPNPSGGNFTAYISSPGKEEVVLTITNLVGQKLKEVVAETNTPTEISLDVPAGYYLLTAKTKNSEYFSKIVVNK